MSRRKVLVIGLDCTSPDLLYRGLGRELESLRGIVEDGGRYVLRSSHPPITIPAWISMATGMTPGELGMYGFRHRRPGDVRESYIVNSTMVRGPAIWDELGKLGMRSVIVGVPPSYPPRPIRGCLISDFTTPGADRVYTWPPNLKEEVERLVGPYVFDVVYRSEEKDRIAKELREMTKQHFKVLRYLAAERRWDFFMFVEIGVDRVHHAFWKYFDRDHPRHVPDSPYSEVIPEYYRLVDEEVGELLRTVPRDTVVIVASDHGVKAMKGAFAINQWLMEQGHLKLRREPKSPGVDLEAEGIDWGRTIAWAWGGYYSRVFINLKGREPRGVVDPRDYDSVVEGLREELTRLRGPDGERWRTAVYRPEELYPVVRGDAPDLMVYFDDLSWRAAGTLGWSSNYLPENDRGPDDAVHDWFGVFSVFDPEGTHEKGNMGEIRIEEAKKTILDLLLGGG